MAFVKFIHAADLHLGAPLHNTDLFTEDWMNRIQQSTWLAFDQLINLAIEQGVDFVLISGDIFDREGYSRKSEKILCNKISRLSNHDIHSYIILGNHDVSIDIQMFHNMFDQNPFVHLFSNERVDRVTHYKEGNAVANIYGRGFWEAPPTEDPAVQFLEAANFDEDILKIAIAHGRVGEVNEYLPCSSFSLEDLKNSSIQYWAMGHMHKRKVHINEIPFVVNPGRIQGASLDELDARGCYLMEWRDDKFIDIRFHSTEYIRWEKREINLSDFKLDRNAPLNDWLDLMKQKIKQRFQEIKKPIIMQLIIKGKTAMYSELREKRTIEHIKQKLSDHNILVFEILDQTVPFINIDKFNSGDMILEQFLSVLEKIKTNTQWFDDLESQLQYLYSNTTLQQITWTEPNQRGRGQWKIKKVKKEWLTWLDMAKKLGIDRLLLKENAKNNEEPVSEIIDELDIERLAYYKEKHDQSIIEKCMKNYESILNKYNDLKENSNDEEQILNYKLKLSQADGELFTAVKQWTIYSMAIWGFQKINQPTLVETEMF